MRLSQGDWVVGGIGRRPHVVVVHHGVLLVYSDLRSYPFRSHRELATVPVEVWIGPTVRRELKRLAVGDESADRALAALESLHEIQTASSSEDATLRFRFHEELPPYLARISDPDAQLKAYADEAEPPVSILSFDGDARLFGRGSAASFLRAIPLANEP